MNNTPKSDLLSNLHGSLIDIVGVMNRPQGDQAIIQEAGIALDRALFALLVLTDRRGPIGVVDLADRIGRDYTTVSRQMAKLEQLGLVERRAGADRRVREAVVTPAGKAMNDAIDDARERIAVRVLDAWNGKDLAQLTRLLRRFADALIAAPGADHSAPDQTR